MSNDAVANAQGPPLAERPPQRWACARAGSTDWRVREGFAETVLGPDAPDWFSLSDDPGARLVKTGYGRAVWHVGTRGGEFMVKSFELSGVFPRLKDLILGHQAQREWRACVEAERRGVAVIRPVAVGVRGGAAGRSVFITEAVVGGLPLQDWLKLRRGRCDTNELLRKVAELFGVSHERGFLHRDGHLGNVLVRRMSDGRAELRYMDLLGAGFRSTAAGRAESVAALAVLTQASWPFLNRSGRMRFLREYLSRRRGRGGGTVHSAEVRSWWRDIDAARGKHAERLARRRDRRLGGDNEYFATIRLAGGWRGRVALHLARRAVLPLASADRTVDEWRVLLGRVVEAIGANRDPREVLPPDLLLEIADPRGWVESICWVLFGSPGAREFVRSHRRRHRDIAGRLVLAHLQQSRGGLAQSSLQISVRSDGPDVP